MRGKIQMSKISSTGTLPIIIADETFTIIGTCNDVTRDLLRLERQRARDDLGQTYVPVAVAYENPFPECDDIYPEKYVDPEQLLITREGATLVFTVTGEVLIQDSENPCRYKSNGDVLPLAESRISIAPLLSIARAYLEHKGASHAILQEYEATGNSLGKVKLDKGRELLHHDLAVNISGLLENQPVRIAAPIYCTGDHFAPWRYLSTAIISHILPAKSFEHEVFLTESVRPRFDSRFTKRRPDFRFGDS